MIDAEMTVCAFIVYVWVVVLCFLVCFWGWVGHLIRG